MIKGCKLEYFNPADRDGWLKLRTKYTGMGNPNHFAVGGSDIATILGYNQYESQLEFYERAIELVPKKNTNNAATYRGTVLEEVGYRDYFRYFNPDEPNVWDDPEQRQRFFDNSFSSKPKIYRTAKSLNAIVSNPKYPHIFINYDKILNKSKWNPKGVLELKNQIGAAMDRYESGINPAYIFQVQGQMLVGNFKYGELFILRNAEMPVSFPMEVNKNIQEQIIDASNEWGAKIIKVKQILHSDASQDEKDMVVMENEPDIQATEAWVDYLKEQHKPENELEVEGSYEILEHALEFCRRRKERDEKVQALLEPEVHIRKFIKDSGATKIRLPEELGHISCKSKLSISPSILQKYEERL